MQSKYFPCYVSNLNGNFANFQHILVLQSDRFSPLPIGNKTLRHHSPPSTPPPITHKHKQKIWPSLRVITKQRSLQ